MKSEQRSHTGVPGQGESLGIQNDQNLTIVCDVRSGACNPAEICWLQNVLGTQRVRTFDRPHAKVWLGREMAIVGSANASANGLGFKGEEATTLVEAGEHDGERQERLGGDRCVVE